MMADDGTGQDGPTDSGSLRPALRVGAVCGASGLIYGGVSGVLRTKHPVIRSVSTGIFWSALGTSYWWMRSVILKEQFGDKPNPNQRIFASTIAGGLAGGSILGAINRRFVPGLVGFSLIGGVGQFAYEKFDNWQMQRQVRAPDKPLAERMAESKWVPVRMLSDEQYRDMLKEKLQGVEVEIALIDDRIQTLREADGPEKSERQ